MKPKIYLNPREYQAWQAAKQVFINEDQWPTGKALAEVLEISEYAAGRILTRFRHCGLLVKNTMGHYRQRRGRFDVVEVKNRNGKE
ncbi:hypothetical protein P7245_22260 [Vibrio parahaemolyticus]|nr:hypothetical protein [Vibrio parahaemolyticus]